MKADKYGPQMVRAIVAVTENDAQAGDTVFIIKDDTSREVNIVEGPESKV